MKRKLWGNISGDGKYPPVSVVRPIAKKSKLDIIKSKSNALTDAKAILKIKNHLVTQTIEVMKQTEMLQSLIETYSNKSGSNNYLLNPCQIIPQVDFPSENAVDFVTKEKFAKPFWFIPPIETNFSQGVPKTYTRVNKVVCKEAIRKAICGQLRVVGFTDIADSALILFTEGVDEFVKNFMEQIKDVQSNSSTDVKSTVDILSLEKAYYGLTSASLTGIHNYFKNNLIAKNRSEIAEFNGVLHEYDKLMKESQNIRNEDDLLNILEIPSDETSLTTNQQESALH